MMQIFDLLPLFALTFFATDAKSIDPKSLENQNFWLRGSVARVGTIYTPALHLTTLDGKRYEVVGDVAQELAKFEGGNTLEILCAHEKEGLLPRVRALEFRILELAGGDKPEIGRVVVKGQEISLFIDANRSLKLQDTPVARRLLTKHGEKVWVVGKSVSGGLYKIWRVGFLGSPSSQPASISTEH